MKLKGVHIFITIVVLAVTASVIAGFITVGAPSKERSRRLDKQRVNDLQQIGSAVDAYWNTEKVLPPNLETVAASRNYYISSITDPATRAPYAYTMTGTSTYTLCATFETDSALEANTVPQPTPAYQQFWEHPAGEKCYALEVLKYPGSPGTKD